MISLKTGRSLLITMMLLMAVPAICCGQETQPPTITVSGTAEIRVVPDYAVLNFSINSWMADLAKSVADNDEKVKAVMAFLAESGMSEKLIRTEMIRIRPVFATRSKTPYPAPVQQQANASGKQGNPSVAPVGYNATRQISITIEDLSSFEKIYRGLIGRGVNEISNLQFHTSDLRKYRDEARLKAVRAAREKAQAMATELGCTLASVKSMTESSGRYQPAFNNLSVSAGESGSGVAAGMIDIKATVGVVFVLGNTGLSD